MSDAAISIFPVYSIFGPKSSRNSAYLLRVRPVKTILLGPLYPFDLEQNRGLILIQNCPHRKKRLRIYKRPRKRIEFQQHGSYTLKNK